MPVATSTHAISKPAFKSAERVWESDDSTSAESLNNEDVTTAGKKQKSAQRVATTGEQIPKLPQHLESLRARSVSSSEDSTSEDDLENAVPARRNFDQHSESQKNFQTIPSSQAGPATSANAFPVNAAPPGWVRVPTRSVDDSQLQRLFSNENLEGKQLWYITVPSSIQICDIAGAPADQLQRGGSVLNHDGLEYGFVSESMKLADMKLLLPGTRGQGYQPAKLSKILHLQQVDNPQGTNGIKESPKAEDKTSRPQPEGLRIRYQPPGFEDGEVEESDTNQSSSPEESDDSDLNSSGSELDSLNEIMDDPPKVPPTAEARMQHPLEQSGDSDFSDSSGTNMDDAPTATIMKNPNAIPAPESNESDDSDDSDDSECLEESATATISNIKVKAANEQGRSGSRRAETSSERPAKRPKLDSSRKRSTASAAISMHETDKSSSDVSSSNDNSL